MEKIAERKRLHEKSVAVVKNWPNTIEGQRMRKLEARKLRAEDEEKKMQLIDREEAKFQQAKRKEAIDKAKTQQYYQTDRVKSFHAAMMLSEVLKERDAQVAMKQKLRDLQQQREEKLGSYHDVDYKEAMEREDREKTHARQQRKNVADYQKQQMLFKSKRICDNLEEELQLGSELRQADLEHRTFMSKKQEQELLEKKALMCDIVDQIQQKERMKEFNRKQRNEEDMELEIFDKNKREIQKMRKDREARIAKQKTEMREKMVIKLQSIDADKYEKEDAKTTIAQKKQWEQEDREKKLKVEQRKKRNNEQFAHLMNETERFKEIKEIERKKNAEDLKQRIKIDNDFHAGEKHKCVVKKEAAIQLKGFHMEQINNQAAKERFAVDQELNCYNAARKAQQKEEEEFVKYANEVIEKVKDVKYAYPLVKAAQAGAGGGHGPQDNTGTRPSFMSCDKKGEQLPAYRKDSTDDVKKIYQPRDIEHAKKRFGFVW